MIAATSGHAQKPDAKPQPAGTISGQVSLRGKPIAGSSSPRFAGDTVNRRDTAARAVTDGQGYYRLTGLPPGQYQIWTLTPGLICRLATVSGLLSLRLGQKHLTCGERERWKRRSEAHQRRRDHRPRFHRRQQTCS